VKLTVGFTVAISMSIGLVVKAKTLGNSKPSLALTLCDGANNAPQKSEKAASFVLKFIFSLPVISAPPYYDYY
jgi:hypothetical protein